MSSLPAVQDFARAVVVPAPASSPAAAQAAHDWLLSVQDNPHTLRSYARTLAEWFDACALAQVDPLRASRREVEAYKAWLFDRGRKPSTVYQRIAVLSSFYRYAEGERLVTTNPTSNVRRPRLPDASTSTGLSRPELVAFLAEARRRGPMVHALMLLLAMNGLRVSEPLSAQVSDLGTERGHHTLGVQRKGTAGSTIRVPLAPVTVAALHTWLLERAVLLDQEGLGHGLLFMAPRRGGGGELRDVTRRRVHSMVRSIARASVPGKPQLHPHDLRHAFITLSLDAGVPLRDVQDSAGHASANTTRRYDRSRGRMDRHATYTLATYLAGADDEAPSAHVR
jgi:site-specific recombinase XerD